MNTDDICALVDRLERAGICELTYREGSEVLTLRLASWLDEPPAATKIDAAKRSVSSYASNSEDILASATGTFSRRHPMATESPRAEVRKGDPVGYLAIESVLSAVPAPADGRIGRQLTEDGKTVGYGDPVLEFHRA